MTYGYPPKFAARQDDSGPRSAPRPGSFEPTTWSRPDHHRVTASVVAIAITRLTELVEQETSALRDGQFSSVADFGARKNHALLELSRLLPLPPGMDQDGAITAKLKALRQTLDVNRGLVQKHIWAVQEVSDLIANVVQQHDSDGTYTRPGGLGAYAE